MITQSIMPLFMNEKNISEWTVSWSLRNKTKYYIHFIPNNLQQLSNHFSGSSLQLLITIIQKIQSGF